VSELAGQFDLEEHEILKRLESARQQLFEAREERPRPDRDEKVLAGWNGLLISTFAEAALVLGEDEYAETAVDALEFVRDRLWDEDEQRLSRRYKAGDVKVDGYLEDYAFLARGAFDCYQATGDVDHLAFALELARVIEAEFWDAERGTLYFTPESGESLVTRPQELGDQSTPSATGVALETLLALDEFADSEGSKIPREDGEAVDEDFEGIAATALETHANTIEANALEHATLCLAADRIESGALEVTIAAEELPDAWRDGFASRYYPDRLFARRPPTRTDSRRGSRRWDSRTNPDLGGPRGTRRRADAVRLSRSDVFAADARGGGCARVDRRFGREHGRRIGRAVLNLPQNCPSPRSRRRSSRDGTFELPRDAAVSRVLDAPRLLLALVSPLENNVTASRRFLYVVS